MRKPHKYIFGLLLVQLYCCVIFSACSVGNKNVDGNKIRTKLQSRFVKFEGYGERKYNPVYSQPSIDSMSIDLTTYLNQKIGDLPDLIPSFIDSIYTTDDFYLTPSWNIFTCTFATFQGIKYRIGLSLKKFFHPMGGGKPKIIITYDPNFICFGLKVGDKIPDSLQQIHFLIENNYPILEDRNNRWRMKISGDRIIAFYKFGRNELVVDSVMKSNKVPIN